MMRWRGELVCEQVDEWTAAYEHPRSVFCIMALRVRHAPSKHFAKAMMKRFGYRHVRHEAYLRADTWAIWWAAPFVRGWDRLTEAFCRGLDALWVRGLLVAREAEPWRKARPNCWPWRGKGGRAPYRRQAA